MRFHVRTLAVTLIIALLQLVLLESGYACRTMSAGHVADEAMAGMSRPGEAMPEQPGAPVESDGARAPCTSPWAPNGCQAMAPCGPAAVAAAAGDAIFDLTTRDGPLTLVELAPSSLSSTPELPPPRA